MKENLFSCNRAQPGSQPLNSLSRNRTDKNKAVAPMSLRCAYKEEHVPSEEDASPLRLLSNRVSALIYRGDVHATTVEDDYYRHN